MNCFLKTQIQMKNLFMVNTILLKNVEKTFESLLKSPQSESVIKQSSQTLDENDDLIKNMTCPKSKDIRNYFKKK
jgi:hypothetical protein